MLDLAINGKDKPVLCRDISKRQQISLAYLQQIINPLVAGGLINTVRGPSGGIALARPAAKITLGEILKLLVGSIAPSECVNDPHFCSRSKNCTTRDIWIEMNKAMEGILNDTTIQDLVDRQRIKDLSSEKMPI